MCIRDRIIFIIILYVLISNVKKKEDLYKLAYIDKITGLGNYCIVGHNYRNSKFFSKVPTLQNGDIIRITCLLYTSVNGII